MARSKELLGERYDLSIDPAVFNSIYLPYLDKIYNYEVYYGGSGSGKSVFIAQKLSIQMTLENGRNCIALRRQKTDARDSVYPEIKKAMTTLGLLRFWDIVEHPNIVMTNRINGNKIIIGGMDDVENIKSVTFDNVDPETGIGGDLSDLWYEEATEETDVAVIRELDRRVRPKGMKGRIFISFNPIYVTHWIKKWMEEEMRGTDILILKTTYKHNKFLEREYIEKLERYRLTDPYSYMVYALGEWGMTGKTVFDSNKIHNRLMKLMKRYEDNPPREIGFAYETDDSGQPVPDSFRDFDFPGGDTLVFKEPQARVPYVVAIDTAGEGSDRFAAHVRDNRTGEQVARYRSDANPDECTVQLFGLCRYYNNALVAFEVNFDSYPVKKFQEWGYTNFYMRDKKPEDIGGVPPSKIGFVTTSANRQFILSELVEWVSINIDLINDIDTLNEMLTFTRQAKKTKGIFWAAAEGSHDDLVMAFAILLQAAEQQAMDSIPETKPIKGVWLQEELEMAYDEGRITYEQMQKFKKSSGYIGVKEEPVFVGGMLYDI